jgi:hypothetical protein
VRIPGLKDDAPYRLSVLAPVTASIERSLPDGLKAGSLALTGRVLAGHGLHLYLPRPESSLLLHAQMI